MDKKIHLGDFPKPDEIDAIQYQKMRFVYNALQDGWSIKKRNDSFIFTKNHEGKKEVLSDAYLVSFMKGNLNMDMASLLS